MMLYACDEVRIESHRVRRVAQYSPMGAPKAEPGKETSVTIPNVVPRCFFGTSSLTAAKASCWSPPAKPCGSCQCQRRGVHESPLTMKVFPSITRFTLCALGQSVWNPFPPHGEHRTCLELIAHPIMPRAFPAKKKFRLPKMSLSLPATVMITAPESDHAVTTHAMFMEGPMSWLIFNRTDTGSTNENKHDSYVIASACLGRQYHTVNHLNYWREHLLVCPGWFEHPCCVSCIVLAHFQPLQERLRNVSQRHQPCRCRTVEGPFRVPSLIMVDTLDRTLL
jgi:hypothetical protein